MLAECGDVNGLDVVDIGCGEGRFCRMLAERGAQVSGIDPTDSFVEMAKAKHSDGDYRIGFAETLPYPDQAFDLAISYLVLLDVEDYRAAIAEMVRVLKPGGKAVVANIQAFVTSRVDPWIVDESGKRLYLAVDNYFEERADIIEWNDISIINYHRPLSAYMDAFIDQGLRLARFLEPVASEESVKEFPGLADYFRVPYMYVMTWQKPAL
jgi:ubiquinone/menaquinone biosynthesis C-methylase UbiE